MKRLRLLALAPLLLASCSRYGEFPLPASGTPRDITFQAEPQAGPLLPRGAPGEWDAVDVLNPSVVRRNQQYENYYSGFDGRTWHTGLALSPDGLAWRKQGKVLSPDAATWEGNYIAANGSALWQDDTLHYWYQAGSGTPRIGLARSRDGRTFRKEPLWVLDVGPRGAWDERGVADPYVVRSEGHFYLFYLGQDRARRQRLGVARSPDGLHWTKLRSNPILEVGQPGNFDERGLGEPAVWQQEGGWWMLYTGRAQDEQRRTGFARSRDGVQWERMPNLPLLQGREAWNAKVLCDPTVLLTGNTLRVWYGGGNIARPDERLNGQIGLFTLRQE